MLQVCCNFVVIVLRTAERNHSCVDFLIISHIHGVKVVEPRNILLFEFLLLFHVGRFLGLQCLHQLVSFLRQREHLLLMQLSKPLHRLIAFLLGLINVLLLFAFLILDGFAQVLLFQRVRFLALGGFTCRLLVSVLCLQRFLLEVVDLDAQLLLLVLVGFDLLLRRREPVIDQAAHILPTRLELGHFALFRGFNLAAERHKQEPGLALGELADDLLRRGL